MYRINDISKYFYVEVACSIGVLYYFYTVINIYVDGFKGTLNDFSTTFNTTLDHPATANVYDGSGCCYDFYSLKGNENAQQYNRGLREELFAEKAKNFKTYFLPTFFLAASLLYSILLKLLFNSCASMSRRRMGMSSDFEV